MGARIVIFDYIRALAILIIVCCHYLEFSGLNLGLGRYLGRVGNMLFFLLSALLYGQKLIQNGGGRFLNVSDFTKRRFVKIASSVWPFLAIITILYSFFRISVPWWHIGANYLFLGYLWKIPGNEHLWFLTVLLVCYAEYVFFAKIKINTQWFPWAYLITMLAIMVIAESLGIPGNSFTILGFFAFVLLKGDWLVEKAKSMRSYTMIPAVLIIIIGAWLFINGLFEESRIIANMLSGICGTLLLVLLIRVLPYRDNKVISFLSRISFEIYIVHHTLCAGPFVRITGWNYSHLFQFGLLLGLSLMFAYALHLLSNKISLLLQSK